MRDRAHVGPRRKPRRLPLRACRLLLVFFVVSAGFFVFSAPPRGRGLQHPAEPELRLDTGDTQLASEESLPPVAGGGERAEQPAAAEIWKTKEEEEEEEGSGVERVDQPSGPEIEKEEEEEEVKEEEGRESRPCATVEEMGEGFREGSGKESLRVRELIRQHFSLHGAANVRDLPPDRFCRQGFVIGKASEAGFGNEMYKILTAAALSIMLNRSLIIGQTRGSFPFGDYISYANVSFTLKEVKHLWRKNKCVQKYGRHLVVRTDDFEKPAETNVLCSDWRNWKQPIIWFQGTTDAVASQFFLKNVHLGMKNMALNLFGDPGSIQSRPNVFGELMRTLISPSEAVEEAVNWVLNHSMDHGVTLHMRMMSNRSVRAVRAALNCVKRALSSYQQQIAKPQVVVVSDTPSFIKDITPGLMKFAEILHFDYRHFEGSISNGSLNVQHQSGFRAKDWGPAPRWVAFVDFFLASQAKHAVISGAHRRVGTTYAQLIAALAAASQLGVLILLGIGQIFTRSLRKQSSGAADEEASTMSGFSFFSSIQSNLLTGGLANQVGWGHAWNRFAGPLSCHKQPHQCAFTALLPSAWWDSRWQSPIARDVRRMKAYGVQVTDAGEVIESSLRSFCKQRKETVRILPIIQM